jgi:excinuclease UvrABC nuclease subunit
MAAGTADRAMSDLNELFDEATEVNAFQDAQRFYQTLPSSGGVYAFCDDRDRLILLASSQSIRRSVKHRLTSTQQCAGPSKRADLAAVTRRLRWSPTYSTFETTLLYYRLARTLYPGNYRKMVAFGPAWFIHVDPQVLLPRFEATNRVYLLPGKYWGPYATRHDAAEAVNRLEDLFDLCRYHEVLDQAPNGQACAYAEMGKCPAPCDGTTSAEHYRARCVEPASAFAWGRRCEQIEQWRQQMEAAARDLAFERAAALKAKIDRALESRSTSQGPARDADDFNYLVVQRGGGTSWIKPFFVTRGRIEIGPPTKLKTLSDVVEIWTRTLADQRDSDTASIDPHQRAEQTWLVSHFLFKAESAPGCFLHQDQLNSRAEALKRLTEAFHKPRRSTAGQVAEPGPDASMESPGAPDHSTENRDPYHRP